MVHRRRLGVQERDAEHHAVRPLGAAPHRQRSRRRGVQQLPQTGAAELHNQHRRLQHLRRRRRRARIRARLQRRALEPMLPPAAPLSTTLSRRGPKTGFEADFETHRAENGQYVWMPQPQQQLRLRKKRAAAVQVLGHEAGRHQQAGQRASRRGRLLQGAVVAGPSPDLSERRVGWERGVAAAWGRRQGWAGCVP